MVVSIFKHICSNPPLASHFPPNRARRLAVVWTPIPLTSPPPLPHLLVPLQPREPPHSLGYSPAALSPQLQSGAYPSPLHSVPSKPTGSIHHPRRTGCQLSSANGRHQREVRGRKEEVFGVEIPGPPPRGRAWALPHYSPAEWPLLCPPC